MPKPLMAAPRRSCAYGRAKADRARRKEASAPAPSTSAGDAARIPAGRASRSGISAGSKAPPRPYRGGHGPAGCLPSHLQPKSTRPDHPPDPPSLPSNAPPQRHSVVEGKNGVERVEPEGCRVIKKKKKK